MRTLYVVRRWLAEVSGWLHLGLAASFAGALGLGGCLAGGADALEEDAGGSSVGSWDELAAEGFGEDGLVEAGAGGHAIMDVREKSIRDGKRPRQFGDDTVLLR
jgi:hypothetical protein